MNNTATQTETDAAASERQLARLIGLAMGVSFILIVALYSIVL